MSTQVIHATQVLAIPVGHRIEARIYAVEEGIFSKAWVARTDEPLIIDHTTGVVYGSGWHFQEINMYQSGFVRPDLPMAVRSDIREHARVVGTVRGCRVAWIGGGDSRYPQTSLVIETEPS
jgi:hypothetical protein